MEPDKNLFFIQTGSALCKVVERGLLCFVGEVPALASLVDITRFPENAYSGTSPSTHTCSLLPLPSTAEVLTLNEIWRVWARQTAQVPAMALALSQPVTPLLC